MLIADKNYFALVRTLTDAHAGSDYFVVMGRAWVENHVQVALCEANIYPASSEDCAKDASLHLTTTCNVSIYSL